MKKLLKRETMPARMKRAKLELEKVSHNYIRRRDATDKETLRGFCFDCGLVAEGQQFQCGHFEPSGSSGAILRYHPHNMHGQRGACNVNYVQETVKINYTFAMVKKYGQARVDEIRRLKNKYVKDDIFFREKLIELYKEGNEQKIVDFLEG